MKPLAARWRQWQVTVWSDCAVMARLAPMEDTGAWPPLGREPPGGSKAAPQGWDLSFYWNQWTQKWWILYGSLYEIMTWIIFRCPCSLRLRVCLLVVPNYQAFFWCNKEKSIPFKGFRFCLAYVVRDLQFKLFFYLRVAYFCFPSSQDWKCNYVLSGWGGLGAHVSVGKTNKCVI